MRTHLNAAILASLLVALAGCGDDKPDSVAADTPSTVAPSGATPTSAAPAPAESGSAEVINLCAPEAPPEERGLEGDPAAPGAPIIDVTAVNYEFQDVPKSLPPGPRGFRLVNGGPEFYELALLRFLTDDQRPLPEIMDLPEHGEGTVVAYVGGVAACPGETTEALGVDLDPGRYGMVSFVSIGTTPDLRGADLLAAYENPSQYTKGMVAEFTVSADAAQAGSTEGK